MRSAVSVPSLQNCHVCGVVHDTSHVRTPEFRFIPSHTRIWRICQLTWSRISSRFCEQRTPEFGLSAENLGRPRKSDRVFLYAPCCGSTLVGQRALCRGTACVRVWMYVFMTCSSALTERKMAQNENVFAEKTSSPAFRVHTEMASVKTGINHAD